MHISRKTLRKFTASLALSAAVFAMGGSTAALAKDGDPSQWGRSVSSEARADGFDAAVTPRHGIFGQDGPQVAVSGGGGHNGDVVILSN